MHLRGFWISGDYVSGAAAKLSSRPRAVVAQQIVPVRSGPDGPPPDSLVAASLCQGCR